MRKIVLIICLLSTVFVFSQEEILSYNTHIKVEKSGDIIIEEKITVRAEGYQIRRGIFRSFPTKYKDRLGNRYKVGFEVIEVLRDGAPEPFSVKDQSNGKVVYIGNENNFLQRGVYTYTIKYKTNRQLGFFDDYDELYYNAIGGDWSFRILASNITIELPEEASIKEFVAFSGISGSTGCACTLDYNQNKASVTLSKPLNPYEQLTFAVSWQKGVVAEPTFAQKMWFLFKDNFNILIGLLGILFVFFTHYFKWRKVGVDPPKGTIIPRYEPPQGFTPTDVSYLQHVGYNNKAITVSIVSLAIKGYLKIIENKKKFILERLDNADQTKLTKEELELAKSLLGSRKKLALQNTNHAVFTAAKITLKKELKAKLSPKYLQFNYKELNKGIIISVVLAIIIFITSSILVTIIFTLILLLTNIVFSYLIKAPTKLGRQIKDEIEGLKMYIETAEKRQLDNINEPELTPERFERILPYAMALGVENKWGNHFENQMKNALQGQSDYRPMWYAGALSNNFSATSFTNSVGSSFSSAISSSSTPPGSSSGSGGGGSSGGGGGGGGGGGW